MIAAMLDHLWQSTVFAGGAGLLTLLLRKNSARARFWVWFAASAKFLVPFAALSAIGAVFLPARQVLVPMDFAPIAEPYLAPVASAHVATAPFNWSLLLLAIWGLGILAVAARWLSRWRKLRVALVGAVDISMVCGFRVRETPARLEPGLFGIFNPVIVLPRGIAERLSPAELDAVLAHETCHGLHRDNLWAAVHMLVEALFWFHPLVWWLGARLNHERERACDEAVLARGQAADIYAESILKVSRLYLHSPLPCVAGVSGAGLKERLERIVVETVVLPLSVLRKALLAGVATGSVIAPLSFGLLTAPAIQVPALAQTTTDAPHPGTEAALRRQIEGWEKKQPVLEELTPTMVTLTKQQQATIQTLIDGWGPLKSITFRENGPGGSADVYLVEFEHGSSAWSVAPLQDGKIAGMGFQPVEKRTDNGPSPGVEDAVRRNYEGLLKKAPAYDIMAAGMIRATDQQIADLEQDAQNLGPMKTLTFVKINVSGWDVYAATFEHGTSTWRVHPLTDGKLSGILWSDVHVPDAAAHPGTEASLRRYIESLENGQPNYDDMTPSLAATVKVELPEILGSIKMWGALKSIAFAGGGTHGMDVYDATFEHGTAEWSIAPLNADGKVVRRSYRPLS